MKELVKVFERETCKSFLMSHIDNGDIYYQEYNVSFPKKVDSIQDNAALAIAGAIRGI